MSISLRTLILVSALTVLLGVSLVYTIRYEFAPKNTPQTSPTSTGGQLSGSHYAGVPALDLYGNPEGFAPGLYTPTKARLVVFAYSSDAGGYVQASVTITGPKPVNGTMLRVPNLIKWTNGSIGWTLTLKAVTEESFNGTTMADLQNPLIFTVWPGVYSVFGTFGSAPPQNETVNLTDGSYGDIYLNFGSSPPQPMGHLIVDAWDCDVENFVHASVTITGQESLSATTTGIETNPSVFTVLPGVYTVTGAYDSAPLQTETATGRYGSAATVNVTAGEFDFIFLIFNRPPS